jgi:hypothetical protein
MSYIYSTLGIYYIKAQAKNENGIISKWSTGHRVIISVG